MRRYHAVVLFQKCVLTCQMCTGTETRGIMMSVGADQSRKG